jgi:hypothetical protein
MSDIANELKQALLSKIDASKQPQLRWVECLSVDWDNKVMDAKGIADDLEYYDIELGAGVFDLKPIVGAICLIGIVEGEECNGFILSASEVEKIEIKANTLIEFNGGTLGSMVDIAKIVIKMNVIEQSLNSLKTALGSWVPVTGDGGAALKAVLATYISQTITPTQVGDVGNNKIKQ